MTNRKMSNEKAQIIIGNIPIKPEVLDDCYDITEYQEAKAMAIQALAKTRWISVSERLPEDLQEVLVTISDEYKLLKVIKCMYTIPPSLFWKDYVTAWLPLPEPYKAESEDKE